ncbi:hypothetical protein D8824_03600 [Streptococcus intermedius]|nr:putative membrane protein [Streptococcus intermedius BA1]RSJ10468.1 hypothetical protein D8833_03570 [Streptococcus intermedius]RSJ16400.1 hypothetical protein D8831_03605 [Streptococcus intermedius]RSJ31811.1 hypothetical protein D8824_03600 [Streptococcus intermedius]
MKIVKMIVLALYLLATAVLALLNPVISLLLVLAGVVAYFLLFRGR